MKGVDLVTVDPESGRSILLFEEADPRSWGVASDRALSPFTVLLAIDADRYYNDVVAEMALRLLECGIGYLCAWGPGCKRVHWLFDEGYVGDGSRDWGRFLMTTDHGDESLAEAIWFAIDLAIHEDVQHVADSAVIVGVDRPEWRAEILTLVGDLAELRRRVIEASEHDKPRR